MVTMLDGQNVLEFDVQAALDDEGHRSIGLIKLSAEAEIWLKSRRAENLCCV